MSVQGTPSGRVRDHLLTRCWLFLPRSSPAVSVVWGLVHDQFLLSLAVGLWVISLVQLRWASVQYLNWQEQQSFGTLVPLNSVVRAVGLVAAALVFRNATATLLIGAIVSVVSTAALSPERPPVAFRRLGIGPLLRLGVPLALASAAVTSLGAWPTLVATRVLSVEEFASFAAQSGLAAAAFGSIVGFVAVFGFPQAKRAWDTGETALADRVVLRFFGYTAGLGWLMLVAFWLFGDSITSILLGPKYSGHAIPTATVGVACIYAVSGLYGWRLRLEFRQNLIALVSISTALVQLPVVFLSADRMGTTGLLASVGCVATLQAIVNMAIVRDRRVALAALFVAVTAGVVVSAAVSLGQ